MQRPAFDDENLFLISGLYDSISSFHSLNKYLLVGHLCWTLGPGFRRQQGTGGDTYVLVGETNGNQKEIANCEVL